MRDKSIKLITTFLVLLFLSSISNFSANDIRKNENFQINIKENQPKASKFWNLTGSPILIDDSDPSKNWSYTALNYDWCSGSGSGADPYVIENVTIDGQGSGSCILIENSKVYFRIENCTVFNSDKGIELNNVNNGSVFINNCSYNSGWGIYLFGNSNNISNNYISNNYQAGIYNNNGNNNNISNNILENNRNNGIQSGLVSYNIISNNTIKNSNFGINTYGNYNYIFNNNVEDSDQCALDLQGNFSLIYQNIVKSSQRGIEITGSNNNISSNVAFNNYRWGILIGHKFDSRLTVNNTITKNNISDCEYGIYLTKSNNNFTENLMYGCGLYIDLETSIEEISSHYIDPTNLVNDKPLYYYVNKSELNQEDFNNAGQVILVNCNDSNISNLNLINASVGLAMYYCQNNTISNNTIDQNSYYGIRLDYCDNNFILRNNGSNNYYGIYVRGNSNNISKNFLTNNECYGIRISGNLTTVYDNYITGNNFGISLGGFYNNLSSNSMNLCGLHLFHFRVEISSHNIEKSNLVNGKPLYYYVNENNLGSADFLNGGQVILINCNNSIISDLDLSRGFCGISLYYCNDIEMLRNDVSYNGYYGISLQESHFNKISENNASNNENGIWLYQSNNNTISGNIVRNNYREISSLYTDGSGIFLFESSGNIIEKNYVTNNQYGINLMSTRYNIIHANTAHSNHYIGILLRYSENCKILENEVTYNANKTWQLFTSWGGIYLYQSSINVIEENNVSNNYYNGLTLNRCYNNTIIKNLLKNNTEKGIEIRDNLTPGYNIIYYNTFLENGLNAEDNGTNNMWDNGIIGNYWDDYGGVDANDDSIGDTPYQIQGEAGSVDNLPIWDDGLDMPIVTIYAPISQSVYGNTAPTFNLSIEGQNIDQIWYTLDEGITNITCGTSGQINQTIWDSLSDGTYTITFYANTTVGNLGFDSVVVGKDNTAPEITINSPSINQEFSATAPTFDLSIVEANLDTIWYALDNGIINITCETSGQINQTLWDALPEGNVTIRFYASDSAGNIGFQDITVIKEISQTPPPGIPGFDLLFLLGIISAITIIIIKKRVNHLN